MWGFLGRLKFFFFQFQDIILVIIIVRFTKHNFVILLQSLRQLIVRVIMFKLVQPMWRTHLRPLTSCLSLQEIVATAMTITLIVLVVVFLS